MVRAADELCVTHGAVSRQIKALEQQLGAKLLAGPRHDLALTPAGRELAASLAAAFDRIAAGLPGAGAGEELVVSSPGTFAMKWLIPRLAGFIESNPGIQVRILEDGGTASFSGVQAAIRLHRGAAPPGVKATPFLEHAYGPVLSPALSGAADREAALLLPQAPQRDLRGWMGPMGRGCGRRAASAIGRAVVRAQFLHDRGGGRRPGVAVTAWAFAQTDIETGRLVAPWGFRPLATRFTCLRPALASHPAADRFALWLAAEGRRAKRPPAAPQ